MRRVVVPLDSDEFRVLVSMAASACRPPREHLRFLLREEAQRRGLLHRQESASGGFVGIQDEQDKRDE